MKSEVINSEKKYYELFIRTRLLGVLISSVLPMFLISAIILYQFYTSYKEKVHAHLSTLVKMHQQDIDTFLDEKLGNISLLADAAGFVELSDSSKLQNYLEGLQREHGTVFVDLGIVNDQGIQVAYAGPFKLGEAQYAETDWFINALDNEYYISDVFLGLRGLPHFIITVKQMFEGQPWILRATIDFVYFNDLVQKILIGETGFAYIVNREGKFQTKPHFEIVPETQFIFDQLKSHEKADIYFLKESNGVFGGKMRVASFLKEGEWILIYQQSFNDAFSSFFEAFKVTLLIVLFGTIGTLSMTFIRFRKMASSIDRAEEEKQMMNVQIIESGKLASVGELAAGIAHEINNPVAIMVEEAGWIEDILEDEEFQDSENLKEFKRALRQINKQGKRCKSITHKLLSFARKTDSQYAEVDMNELLEEIISLSAQRAKYSSVEIHTNFQQNLPLVKVSQAEMQQVFLNLINNALDAMEKVSGRLDISSKQDGDDIVIDVADNGPGIPGANILRIFDPFFTTKAVGKGTGLGLSICYGIIKSMGGEITVQSQVGSGTTFSVRFPIKRKTEDTSENEE